MRGLKAVGVLLCLLLPISAAAQIPTAATATVHGTVVDPTGAVIPGASVELLDTATNIARTTDTDGAGEYRFVSVLPGVYTITVTMEGFRTQRMPGVKVDVAKSYLANFMLEVGAVAEVVEVTAGAAVELQTVDATVGAVVKGETLLRLPNINRDIGSYAFLQPAISPAGYGFNVSGAVAGARGDQHTWTLDGIDATQSKFPESGGTIGRAIPVPAEGIEEFRVGVTNPNATFGRSAGGQFAAVRKRGGSAFHGSAYWYHQNDNLNANSWVNNRADVEKAEMKDNRFGFTVGGPIIKEKTFFFAHFEERRFPESDDIERYIPTASLRAGTLRFRDMDGNIVSYPLATAALCGQDPVTGARLNLPCDPRGIGISPVLSAMYALYPDGNDPALGDGLNTIGFRDTADSSEKFRYGSVRLDHHFTENWRAEGTLMFARELGMNPAQLDIAGLLPGNVRGKAASVRSTREYPRQGVIGLTGAITPRLTNEARFGWTRWYYWRPATNPFPQVPGINAALSLAGEGFTLLTEPVDVETQRARGQGDNQHLYQIVDNLTWVSGRHTIQAGGTVRIYDHFHSREDKVVGGMTSVVAQIDDGSFVTIPDSQRPPACGGAITTNCLMPGDITQWNRLYAATLGLLDSINFLGTRDGDLNPNAPGTPLMGHFHARAWEFYFSDTWRLRPSLTLTYGVNYQWQEPPKEEDDRLTMMTDSTTGEILTREGYIGRKHGAALAGNVYNPEIAYMPLRSLGRRRTYDTDWSNLGPRVSFAWNPSYTDGFLGRLFGDRKTVLRGGYSLVFDRVNFVQVVSIPMLGVGFGQAVNFTRPNLTDCSVSGAFNTDATNACRVGVDTALTIPTLAPVSAPVIPSIPFGEMLGFQVDPDIENGRNNSVDFTIQREIPGDMILELGWTGRWARNLNQGFNFSATPYMMLDPISGQYFHQAYDVLGAQLRYGVPAGAVTTQPWFENQLPPLADLVAMGTCSVAQIGFVATSATQCVAATHGSDIIEGSLFDLWVTGLDFWRLEGGMEPVNNLQVLDLFVRSDGGKSVYHGMILTLRKRMSHGLAFDFNYTWSRSLDTVGSVQNAAGYYPSPFNPGIDYGPSYFDFTHRANLNWYYELPFGRTGTALDKLIGGWYTSGIFEAFSGAPNIVIQTDQVFGGGGIFTYETGAIPTVKLNVGNNVNTPVAGSGGVGEAGNPATGGTGMNLFADPEAVFNSFRHIVLSQDGRTGRANPIRGLPHWFFDFSVGKKTSITETTNIVFSLDFFNLFNNPQFEDPSLNLLSRGAFGVINDMFGTYAPRRIQFGFRFEF